MSLKLSSTLNKQQQLAGSAGCYCLSCYQKTIQSLMYPQHCEYMIFHYACKDLQDPSITNHSIEQKLNYTVKCHFILAALKLIKFFSQLGNNRTKLHRFIYIRSVSWMNFQRSLRFITTQIQKSVWCIQSIFCTCCNWGHFSRLRWARQPP